MFEDDENEDFEDYEFDVACLYSDEELCQYVVDALEKKHPVKISEIQYVRGDFYFSISVDLTEEMGIPNCWHLHRFGEGKIHFSLSLDDFQALYHKLDERDFIDAVRVTIEKLYGSVADIISINHAEEPLLEGAVEVVLRLKHGCKFENNHCLSIDWIEGDKIAFQIDFEDYRELIESWEDQ